MRFTVNCIISTITTVGLLEGVSVDNCLDKNKGNMEVFMAQTLMAWKADWV